MERSSQVIITYFVILVITLEKNPLYVRTVEKGFAHSGDLTKHYRINTGENPLYVKIA